MSHLNELLAIVARLRDPVNGCPWDLQQDYASLVPYVIEEAYELADAIENGNKENLSEELGDLLFHIVFYCQLATEDNTFTFADVLATICNKMITRHPHVFLQEMESKERGTDSDWERHKAAEHQRNYQGHDLNILDSITKSLPALTRSQKIQSRAALLGFDWPDAMPVFEKLDEEIKEIREALSEKEGIDRIKEEVGDLIFTCVNLARKLDIDSEQALRVANQKFESRFNKMNKIVKQEGKAMKDYELAQLEILWQRTK